MPFMNSVRSSNFNFFDTLPKESENTDFPAINFTPADKIKERRAFGHTKELNACVGIGLSIVNSGCKDVLVFGYPGTGVHVFPEVVVSFLNINCGQKFSFVSINCNKLLYGRSPLDFGKLCTELKNLVKNNSPMIVQVEGMEIVNPFSLESEAEERTQTYLNRMLRVLLGLHSDRTLVIGTTYNVRNLDLAIAKHFGVYIYLEPTDKDTIIQILTERLDNNGNPAKIAQQLISFMGRFGLRISAYELCRAIDEIKQSNFKTKDISARETVDLLLNFIYPCYAKDRIKEYEAANSPLITLSKKHMIPFWSEIFEEKNVCDQ